MLRELLLLSIGVSSPFALAAPPHVHGVAHLDIAIDGNQLTLMLESPLDNLIGFEHAPRTPAQKAAVDGLKRRLNRPEALFVPTTDAQCRPGAPKLESAIFDTVHHSAEAHANEAHADLDASFTFTCAQPSKLTGLEVKLLEAYPKTHKLLVQIAGPHGQKAVELTPTQTRVSW